MAEITDNLDYGTITGQFTNRSTDNTDTGKRPQLAAWQNLKAVFVPEVPSPQLFRDLTPTDPQTFTMFSFMGATDTDGNIASILDMSSPDMQLPASISDKIDPSGFTWRVRIFSDDDTTLGGLPLPAGVTFPTAEFSFTLGADETKDLTTLDPVPSNPGAEIIDWDAAVARAQAEVVKAADERVAAEAARDVALQAAADAEAFAGAVDPTTIVRLTQLARDPDQIITGAITRNGSDVITSASVQWPGAVPGTFTTDAIDPSGAINGYHITYGSPVTKTFTQPTMTRNAQGAVTVLPQIVVS